MGFERKLIFSSLNDVDTNTIFQAMPIFIYCKDLNGHYVSCNEQFVKEVGKSNINDIIGKTDRDLFPKNIAEEFENNDKKIFSDKSSIAIGEHHYFSKKIPIFDKNNNVIGLIGMSINIKEYKESKEIFDEIMDNIPGHIYWKDTNYILLGSNLQQALDVGLESRDMIVGKTTYEITSKALPEEVRREHVIQTEKADSEVMESGQPKTFEERFSFADGSQKAYVSHKKPLFDKDGHVRGLLGISVDITERKQLEEKLQKANVLAEASNQLKTEFIENMQHDIRTPISGIWSMLDSMVKSKDLQSFAKMLPYMLSASKELLDICNEVIDFENATYGDKPLYSRKFSLLNMVHSAINLNSAAAIAHQNQIELTVENDVPDIIKGDDYRLKKILINLVGNAVKFTEKGKISLFIEKIKQEDKRVTLRFHIKDSGIGIPGDKMDTIFEKFTKLTPSNTGKFKGTGLGLHIVKKFSNEIGADIDVISTEGKGTEFTLDVCFDLPLVEQLIEPLDTHAPTQMRHLLINPPGQVDETEIAEPAIQNIPSKTTTSADTQNAIQVILIEDDNIAMMVAEARFKDASRPCQVHKAENVADALVLLKKQKADLVVSDIGLPDGTGFDIIEVVKRDSSHINYQTPFVALTAHSDDAKKERAKQTGFLALYNKPLLQQHADKILADFIKDNTLVDNQEAVDIIVSQEITGGDKETVIQLLNVLIASFSKDKNLFEIAFHNNDFKQARELFHKFRGGLSYIRAPEVERLAKELHEAVKELEVQQGNLQSLKPKLDKLINAVDNVELWLSQNKL